MKVFKVVPDGTSAVLNILDEKRSLDDEIVSAPLGDWRQPRLTLRGNGKSGGNFIDAGKSALVFDTRARDAFRSIFEAAGELIELNVTGFEPLHLLNVREICNALDRSRSHLVERTRDDTYDISKFVFKANRIGTFSSLFKLPELGYRDVLTYTEGYAQEDHENFYLCYRSSGMTGLAFEEIWSD